MACPTCSYSMQTFGSLGNFWCPRCGTIVRVGGTIAGVPKLVERCREFENRAAFYPSQWHELGIAESINVPEMRQPAP